MGNNIKKRGKNEERALVSCLHLFSAFYPHFFLLESTLKQKLNNLLKDKMGESWLLDQLKVEPIFCQEKEFILRRKSNGYTLTDQGFLKESGFGIWVEFFNRSLYKSVKGWPIHVFQNLPSEIKRNDLYRRLYRLKEFRNQLYHSRIQPIVKESDINRIEELLQIGFELEEVLKWFGGLPIQIINTNEIQKRAKKLRAILNS